MVPFWPVWSSALLWRRGGWGSGSTLTNEQRATDWLAGRAPLMVKTRKSGKEVHGRKSQKGHQVKTQRGRVSFHQGQKRIWVIRLMK